MTLRLLYFIFARLCSWLVLLGRSTASKDAELVVVRHEALVRREALGIEGGARPPRWAVAAVQWELSAVRSGRRRGGREAALTKPERFGTARQAGPGERDQTVYERNQWQSSVSVAPAQIWWIGAGLQRTAIWCRWPTPKPTWRCGYAGPFAGMDAGNFGLRHAPDYRDCANDLQL